jgi:hypothetical protein
MQALIRKLNGNQSVVYGVLFLSALYIAFLASSVREGIFYAGDQALKSLEVKQIAEGYGFKYLHVTQPDWVCALWKAGYSPLKPPFFYPSQNGYMIVYPPLFQIVSAFFYSRLGSAGLYILPLVCTFLLLGWTAWLLKSSGIKPFSIALGIFILVFCSPLIVYGTMFWEHLPAVLLLFAGLAFIVRPPRKIWAAAGLGLVTGLAIWLRPEALMMNFLYCLAVAFLYLRERKPVYLAFLVTVALSILPWMAFNVAVYGSIFGIHAKQVFVDHNPDTRMSLSNGLRNLYRLNYLSVRNFSFLALLVPIVWRLVRRRETDDLRPWLLSAIIILYSLITPFVLPNDGVVQWGPRYFLAIIPIMVIVLVLVEKKWNILAHWSMPIWLTLYIVVGGWNSFYHNTHGAYKELSWRYNERLEPTYNLIKQSAGNVIIVSRSYMMYDFGYLFDKNIFFAESGDDSLRRLLPELKSHGVRQFIYIFDPREPSLPKMLEDSSTRHLWVDAAHKVFIKKDVAGKVYTIR